MKEGITIGKAATFIGTTAKAIRHYHKLGLVDEPPRDSSGYRRYGSAEVLQLAQVRTLAVAGVPLAKIKLMLARHTQHNEVFTDIEQRLTERIEDLTRRRDALRNLTKSNQEQLPDRALALLKRSAELGLTPEEIIHIRESFMLAKALFPNSFSDYIAHLEAALDDDVFIAFTKLSWEAITWKPNDPRIEALAVAMADHLLASPKLLDTLKCFEDHDKRHAMINRFGTNPTWSRLNMLFEDRLCSGGVDIQDNNGST